MSISSAYVAELATATTALAGYGQDKIDLADEATRKCFQDISSAVKDISAGTRSSISYSGYVQGGDTDVTSITFKLTAAQTFKRALPI